MASRSQFTHSAGAVFGTFLLLTAAPASGQVPYTPTTTLLPAGAFTIDQINDNPPALQTATSLNGFATPAASGDITFTFPAPMDLTGFDLHNNIKVDAFGGVANYWLEFFDGVLPIGQTTPTQAPNQLNPSHTNLSLHGITSVVMHVTSSHGPQGHSLQRIEIREVDFQGAPASFSLSCAEVRRLGFTPTTLTITRTSNAVQRGAITIPYSYSVGPLRAYGDTNVNRMFIDSFPLNPDPKRHVCGAEVTVTGSSASVVNNDGLSVFLPSNGGQIWEAGVGWKLSRGTPLKTWKLVDNMGPWTRTLAITGQDPAMAPALAAALSGTIPGGPYIDIWVHDDSVVNSASVSYTLY